MPNVRRSNFTFLKEHDERLLLLGVRAEQYFPEDPNTCIVKTTGSRQPRLSSSGRRRAPSVGASGGELVPQDPNGEPAAGLLALIRSCTGAPVPNALVIAKRGKKTTMQSPS